MRRSTRENGGFGACGAFPRKPIPMAEAHTRSKEAHQALSCIPHDGTVVRLRLSAVRVVSVVVRPIVRVLLGALRRRLWGGLWRRRRSAPRPGKERSMGLHGGGRRRLGQGRGGGRGGLQETR